MKYAAILNGEEYDIEIDEKSGQVTVNGEPRNVDFTSLGPALYSLITDYRSLQAVINQDGNAVSVLMGGRMYETQVLDERALLMAKRKGGLAFGSGEVKSPMPGLIVDVPVNEGDMVASGQTVAVLESMKMQNELKSPIDGVVQTVNVSSGQNVDKDATLVIVEAPEE